MQHRDVEHRFRESTAGATHGLMIYFSCRTCTHETHVRATEVERGAQLQCAKCAGPMYRMGSYHVPDELPEASRA